MQLAAAVISGCNVFLTNDKQLRLGPILQNLYLKENEVQEASPYCIEGTLGNSEALKYFIESSRMIIGEGGEVKFSLP